jgi:hypothetical protein
MSEVLSPGDQVKNSGDLQSYTRPSSCLLMLKSMM